MKHQIIHSIFRRGSAGFFSAAIFFACVSAYASGGTFTWSGGSVSTGNWTDGANWGGTAPGDPQNFLNFNGALRTSSTNDFANGSPGQQLYFKNGANAFTLYGNSITFYDFGAVDPNIQNEGAFTNQTISFAITNGNTHLSGGFGILNVNLNTSTAQGPLTFNGAISSASAANPRVINISGSNTVTFNGVISDFPGGGGTNALTQLGTNGTTVLTASNTFTGDTTINNGTLRLATNSALANGVNFIRLGDTFGTQSANLNLNSGNNLSTSINVRSGSSGIKTIANTAGTIGNAAFLGKLFLDADVTLLANAGGTNIFSSTPLDLKNQTLTVSGPGATIITGALTNSTGNGKVVTSTSAGPLTLAGSNSHAGGTTLGSSAVININSPNALGTGTFTVGGNGTFDNTSGVTISNANNNALTLSGGSPIFIGTGDLNFGTGPVTISGNNRTITVNSNALTLGGVISASTFTFTKAGAGTLILSGASTYSGSTTVSAGAIQYQGGSSMNTNSTLTISSGAVVQLRADASSTFTNGTLNPAGGATVTFDVNQLTGAGANNVLTLASTNANFSVGGNGTMTFNVTGGNSDSLAILPNANFTGNTGNGWTLVPTTANVNIVGNITGATGNGAQVLTLDGTSGSNTVSGVIGGAFAGSPILNKTNSSTWILAAANTFTGDTRVIGGTLQLNNALALQNSSLNLSNIDGGTLNVNNLNATFGGLKGQRNLALGTGTVSVGNNGATTLYSGQLSGNALTKVGSGTFTLTGTNLHTGATTISAGELIGSTAGSVPNSAMTVNAGATNGILLASAGGKWTCANLTYGAGSTFADFNFNGFAPSTTTAPLLVNGNLAFSTTLNVIVRAGGATIAPGTYPLIKYSGTLSGTPPPTTLSLPVGVTATIVNNTGNKSIDLNVTVGNAVSWAVGSGTWDINTTANWTNNVSGPLVKYLDGEAVLLDDSATTSPAISLGVTVTPASITVSNVARAYTISPTAPTGFITGSGPLVKNGSGTLTVATTNNTYTGTITLNGGTLALSGLATLGTGTLIMSNGTTLNVPNIAPPSTTPTIIVGAGAMATHTVAGGNTGGFAGSIASGDSASVLIVSGASYSGAFQMFSNFTGTVQVNSGSSGLRFSSTSASSFGGSNATFNIVSGGTMGPRDTGHNVYLGALTGAGTLSANTTASTTVGTVPYFIGSKNLDSTFSGTITDRPVTNFISVTKIGSATLTLSGTNTYWGATTVASGGLMGVTGGSCSNSPVTVNSGATNGVNVTVSGGFWTCTNLTYAAGTETAVFAFGVNTPSTTVAPLQVQNSVTISGTLNFLITGGSTTIPVGAYPLIKYTGTQTGLANTNVLSLPLGVYGYIGNDTASKQIVLIVTNVIIPNLVWTAGTGNWDVTSINWTNIIAGGLTNWLDNYLAQFDDTASGAGPFTVTLTTNVNPIGVIFTNSTKDYTLAGGNITGSGTLNKSGSGKLTLLTTNAATGGMVVSGGTLQGSSGTLLGNIANNAALIFDQSVNGSNNAVISGTGSLTKQNSGALALGGNNNYTGKTVVNAGTLAISAGANVGANPGGATPDQITINGATLLATNGAATITLPTNAGLTVTNTATIDVASGITLDYPAQAISGGGSLIKNGAGTFQIDEGTASSTYTNLVLNAGTIAFNKSSGGLGAGSLVINGGVIRTTTSSARTPNNSSVLVNGDFTLGSSTTAAISFSGGGAWTLANGTRTITVDTIVATITGVVGDGGNNYGLTKAGSGTLVLSVADTYTGPTLINAGALKLANNLAAGTNTITAAGTLQIANGINVANGFTATQTFESMDVPDAGAIGTFSGTAGASGGSANFRFMASGSGAALVFSNATVNTGSKSLFATRGNIVYAGNSAISSTTASLIGRSAGNPASLIVKDNAVCNFTAGFSLGNSGGINSSVALTMQDSASLTTGTSGFDFLGTTVASSSVSLNGGTLAAGAFFKTGASAETLSLNGGTIKANAASASFFPSLTGLTANVSTGGALLNDNGFNITIAQPLLHDTALGAMADGGLTKSGAGVTTLSGTNTYYGATAVNGGTLLVSGVLGTNVVTVNTNATLSGTGVISGATTFAPGGTLQAGLGGNDTSTLTISNSLALAGNAKFNLNRTNAQTANLINGLASVNFGGALTVTNTGDALQSGDTFTLFTAGSYTGSFANIALPPLTGVLVWNTNNLAVNGTISVIIGISPTALALTSSSNPSGYLDVLAFTATLAPTNATGDVTFYNGATPFSTNTLTLGIATSGSISTFARGTNTITATYPGDPNYYGSTNSLAQIVTNHPPVAPTVNYYRVAGINTFRITIADLLTNVTDADADMIALSATGISTNGITLFNGSGFLLYQNTNNVNDQFTYNVDDANGGVISGNVNVVLQPFVTGQNATVAVSGSTATVSFNAIPGYSYGLQRSTNLTIWATILTTNAPANGAFRWTDDFSDLGVVPGSAYYRLQWNP